MLTKFATSLLSIIGVALAEDEPSENGRHYYSDHHFHYDDYDHSPYRQYGDDDYLDHHHKHHSHYHHSHEPKHYGFYSEDLALSPSVMSYDEYKEWKRE